MARMRYERFKLDYPAGYVPISVAAIPFSQLKPEHEQPLTPHCPDRRWNREVEQWGELHPQRNRNDRH